MNLENYRILLTELSGQNFGILDVTQRFWDFKRESAINSFSVHKFSYESRDRAETRILTYIDRPTAGLEICEVEGRTA